MHRHIKPAALTAAAVLAAGFIPILTATAAPTTAPDCVKAGLVWVSVEHDDNVTGACAEKFGTASEALLDTGLTTETGDFITTVDGRKADADKREWWSVYSKAAGSDGSFPTEWDFAQVGVTQLKLAPGNVLSLALQPDWNLEAVAPKHNPVEGVTLPISTPSASPTQSETPTSAPTQSTAPTSTPSVPGVPSTGN